VHLRLSDSIIPKKNQKKNLKSSTLRNLKYQEGGSGRGEGGEREERG
jgi:hypothetical protein